MTDIQDWLDEGRALADHATEGPWFAEYSRKTGDCVVPYDAQSTREAVAITRLMHAPSDAVFIADARTRLPQALAAIQAVLDIHQRGRYGGCAHPTCDSGSAWPCPTVEMIQDALGTDA